MKSNKVWKTVIILCVIALIVEAAIQFLPLLHADEEQLGNAEISADIRNLEIQWAAGKVTVAYHTENVIRVSEKTSGLISGDMRLRWFLEGDTLRIEYDQPGFHLLSLLPHSKELTVTLPQGIALDNVSITAASAELNIPILYANSVNMQSDSGAIHAMVDARSIKANLTSGAMEMQVMREAEQVLLESASGAISLVANEAVQQASVSAVSGKIRAIVKQAGEFKATSTSGDIQAAVGQATKAVITSTSGKVFVETDGIDALSIRTISGGVTAYLPVTPGFTARIDTVSGRFMHQLPMTEQGNTYVAGDGSGKVEISTVSGNILLSGKEGE